TKLPVKTVTRPALLEESAALIGQLRRLTEAQIGRLMGISDKLAVLNVQRYRDFTTPFTRRNARPALLAFKGDVYQGIDVERYTPRDFAFAQQHLRILSGLYGVVRPL